MQDCISSPNIRSQHFILKLKYVSTSAHRYFEFVNFMDMHKIGLKFKYKN